MHGSIARWYDRAVSSEADATSPRSCPAGRVDLWRIRLSGLVTRPEVDGCLSEDEYARASRYRFPEDRTRFSSSRAALRTVLGRYLHCAPRAIRFRYGPEGKPALVEEQDTGLRFNLSHSGELALLVVAWGREVGADVERVPSERVVEEVGSLVLCAREQRRVARQGEQSRREFARIWTRKEAYVKGVGGGLTIPLDRVDVGGPGGRLLLFDDASGTWAPNPDWTLRSVRLGLGYAGAIAVEGSGWRLARRTWP